MSDYDDRLECPKCGHNVFDAAFLLPATREVCLTWDGRNRPREVAWPSRVEARYEDAFEATSYDCAECGATVWSTAPSAVLSPEVQEAAARIRSILETES